MRSRPIETRRLEHRQAVEVHRDGAWVGHCVLTAWQLVDDGDGPYWRGHVDRYGRDEQDRPALWTEWYPADRIRLAGENEDASGHFGA